MPLRLPTPCRHRGCKATTRNAGGYCDEHLTYHSGWRQKRKTEVDARYHTKRWQRLRLLVLHERPLCAECGKPAGHVDHIRRAKAGGEFWDEDNLQPLCERCHMQKSQKEGQENR